jgi:hypothetical protein
LSIPHRLGTVCSEPQQARHHSILC